MARITGPVCRLCRREGIKLFLKGARCDTDKCAVTRRQTPPGMHSYRRGKLTDYGLHLREKQKVKHYYGVLERQFRQLFQEAQRSKGNTGEALMSLLERRLDNVVHRLGFALSRAQARQIVRHGHILVNGRRVDIPSYLVRPGDVISVKPRPKIVEAIQANMAENRHTVPDFLQVTAGPQPEGHVLRAPGVDDVSIPVQVQLILELLSR
ncbi:MAG: 30S ribosomal protein S4 [Thermoguttaceae bacterium]|jgi:small subunit ribosomal protein S4|nr:30S ribosomal protein S4 [Thermoguttaceae bacterium]